MESLSIPESVYPIFLGLEMNWVEIVGIILVIVAIYILQRGRRNMEKINYREDEF